MSFVRGSRLLVLLVVVIAPACSAEAARVTLASGASRTCTGETRVRMLRNLREPASVGQEQSGAMSETLSVRRTGDQYEIRRSNLMPGGETLLIAHIRPDGTVTDATMSGNIPIVGGGERLQQASMLAARMLSERLLMGREFRPGDDLYANVDRRDLVAGMMGAMGAPPEFQMQMAGSLPFTGMTGNGTNRSLNFAGEIRATGNGQANGQTMTMAFPSRATITMDATTGLMRGQTTEGTMAVTVNGVTQVEMRMVQSMTCTISPAR